MLAFADRLRSEGIDASIDQYELFPPRGWIEWMEQQIEIADWVVILFSADYGKGRGAAFESRLVKQVLYNEKGENKKYIPAALARTDLARISLQFQSYTHFDIETGYEGLYRLITNQPKTERPVLGTIVPLAPRKARKDYRIQFWSVPAQNPLFTGRDKLLEELHGIFAEARTAAIYGLGGMGKTQSAIEYAYRHRGHYASVFWIVADTRDAMVTGFAAIARLVDLPEKDEKDLAAVAAAVRAWLESNHDWLLILDNVEDLNLVREFRPAGGSGFVLITTKRHGFRTIARGVEIKEMNRDEGAETLLKCASIETPTGEDERAAVDLAKELGGLPLALDHAGAFIEEMRVTVAEYLKLYGGEGKKLRAAVAQTFSLALTQVEKRSPAAAEIVRMCAFLAPNSIPEEILAGSLSPLDLTEAIGEAGRFSLIRRNPKDKTIDIHRLVQEAIKDEMEESAQRLYVERLVEAMNNAFPYVEFETWPQCERLISHVQAALPFVERFNLESSSALRLLSEAGWYLEDRAQYAEAEPLYKRSLAIAEKTSGPDHPETAASLNNLANLYTRQGRLSEAEPLHGRSLAIKEASLGPNDPDTATALNNLASLYIDQRRYQEAEPLLKRALGILEERLGADHTFTAGTLSNLAALYHDQSRYAEAEPFYKRAVEIVEKALSKNDPGVARHLHNLANLYYAQHRFAEAEPLYQRALAIHEAALGPRHPDTLSTVKHYAKLLRDTGRETEADTLEARFPK